MSKYKSSIMDRILANPIVEHFSYNFVEYAIGAFLFSVVGLIVAAIVYSVKINKSPVTVTKVTDNCVLIEQAGFKTVNCTNSVNVDSYNTINGE